jgi:hypothetical protein
MRVARSVLAGVVMVVGGVTATAPAAQATISQCNSGWVCMWGNNNYDWLLVQRYFSYTVANLPTAINDKMDSWANLSTWGKAAAYEHYNGGGGCQSFDIVSRDPNVAPWHSDEVSSWKTNGLC